VAIGVDKVRYVKIDVEGHERQVLAGAIQTIKRWRPVLQVEIEQRHHRDPIAGIFGWIVEQGYSGFFFDSAQRRLRPLDEFRVGSHQILAAIGTPKYVNNFVFLSHDSAQRTVEAVHAGLEADGVESPSVQP
jgi:hypothetical protein